MRVYEASIKYRVVGSIPAIRTLNTADRVAEYMRDAFDNNPFQESFWIIALNRKNRPIARHMVTLGTATATLADPVSIFRPLFLLGATTAFIVCHQHPSGDPTPSVSDLQLTRQLKDAGTLLNLPLLDHVVIGDAAYDPAGAGFYSFRSAGLV